MVQSIFIKAKVEMRVALCLNLAIAAWSSRDRGSPIVPVPAARLFAPLGTAQRASPLLRLQGGPCEWGHSCIPEVQRFRNAAFSVLEAIRPQDFRILICSCFEQVVMSEQDVLLIVRNNL